MNRKLKKIRLIIFDLDGTLIDSASDIAASVNAVLEKFGYKILPQTIIGRFIGDGVTYLLYRSIWASLGKPEAELVDKFPECPVNEDEFEIILSWYLEWYKSHPVMNTRLYPGVTDLLEGLKANYTFAVLSNKSVHISRKILTELGIAGLFQLICGPEDTGTKKPDPKGIENIISLLNGGDLFKEKQLKKSEILMVGDSKIDISTGKNSGILTCFIKQGYGNQEMALSLKPDLTLNEVKDLGLCLS